MNRAAPPRMGFLSRCVRRALLSLAIWVGLLGVLFVTASAARAAVAVQSNPSAFELVVPRARITGVEASGDQLRFSLMLPSKVSQPAGAGAAAIDRPIKDETVRRLTLMRGRRPQLTLFLHHGRKTTARIRDQVTWRAEQSDVRVYIPRKGSLLPVARKADPAPQTNSITRAANAAVEQAPSARQAAESSREKTTARRATSQDKQPHKMSAPRALHLLPQGANPSAAHDRRIDSSAQGSPASPVAPNAAGGSLSGQNTETEKQPAVAPLAGPGARALQPDQSRARGPSAKVSANAAADRAGNKAGAEAGQAHAPFPLGAAGRGARSPAAPGDLPTSEVSRDEAVSRDSPSLLGRADAPASAGSWQTGALLILLLAAAGAALWVRKRKGLLAPGLGGEIEVLATRNLGGKNRVILLRSGNREMLLGTSDKGLFMLESWEGAEAGAESAAQGRPSTTQQEVLADDPVAMLGSQERLDDRSYGSGLSGGPSSNRPSPAVSGLLALRQERRARLSPDIVSGNVSDDDLWIKELTAATGGRAVS